MTLDTQSAAVVAAVEQRFPRLGTEVLDATEARRILAENPAPQVQGPAVASVVDTDIPGPPGAPNLRVRIYRPRGAGRPAPAVVFFHGGGFVICSLDTHDAFCRELANGTDSVVISVDYRLAPEARWPAQPHDAYAATVWASKHTSELGIDSDRIAVAGDSAGATLAAAVALQVKASGGPRLAAQLLVYPMLDTDFSTDSYQQNSHGYAVTIDHLRWYWEQYLGPTDPDDPLATPLRAADLTGLPPAIIVTAEHCPLRTENERYAARLSAAGVPIRILPYPGVAHGFFTLGHVLDTGRRANTEAFAALREVFGA